MQNFTIKPNLLSAIKTIFLAWLTATISAIIIYGVLSDFNKWSFLNFLGQLFFKGIFTVVFSYVLLTIIYTKVKKNRLVVLVLFYLFVLFFMEVPYKYYGTMYSGSALDESYYTYNSFYLRKTITMLMFVVITHISYLDKYKKDILKHRALMSQQNYQQLKSQLSPHFLFNNLNVLTSIIEENPSKAVVFSEKLATIYRYFLEQEKEDIVGLNNELNFAKDYLELFKQRYENGFKYNINVSQIDLKKYVLSSSLQQLLENIFKHNETSTTEPISIQVYIEEEYLCVRNSLSKKTTIKSLAKGLQNIKERYAFFTTTPVVVIEDELSFTVKLPLLKID